MTSSLDSVPVVIGPATKRSERLVERSPQVGELVERGGVDMFRVKLACDQPVAFCPSQRVGEDLVGDPVQGIVQVVVATPLVS